MHHPLAHPLADASLHHIAARYGTPSYVYDLATVTRQVAELRRALPEALLYYAVKANPNRAVLAHLAAHGLGAEVITVGELTRALAAGFPPSRVLLGGPGQGDTLIGQATQTGVGLVSLDSVSQLEDWLTRDTPARFLLRVNPALDPGTHEHLATGAAGSKFGLPLAHIPPLAARLAQAGKLAGFHIHVGSQISRVSVYDDLLDLLTPLYEAHPEADTLDIGGGFAVPDFPLEAFASRVYPFAKRFGLRLLLEPGRYLVAAAGVLLTRVLHVKDGPVRHVIADAGMADLLRPALYDAAHPIRLLSPNTTPSLTTDVDGPLCENADRLGRNVSLPPVARGDLLAVEMAGAYGLTMASNYASSLRPAEITVHEGDIRLVRRRETVEDLLRLERLGD